MPSGITIVGLGPGHSQQWTLAVYQILTGAAEVFLRTENHPSRPDIPGRTTSFDGWYTAAEDPGQTHRRVAAELVRLGRREHGVIYAVPGHPRLDEPTTPLVQDLAAADRLPLTIIPGLSYLAATLSALDMQRPAELQVLAAERLAGRHHPPLEPDRPALITGVSGSEQARQVRRVLGNAYAGAFVVTLVQFAGSGEVHTWRCPLAALADQPRLAGSPVSLYLPADESQAGYATFQETIAHLRAPDGCPWDREQTHQTLRPFLLEETYEVLEALDAGEAEALAEELGDLLLQIVLHTQIAIDHGDFNMGTVIGQIHRKLVRRHPHVFGDVQVNGVSEVTSNWETIKRAEKAAKGENSSPASALDGVPPALPALAQALAISKRAVRVGFEWPAVEGVLEKIIEEAREVAEAESQAALESEIGDLLFSVVNLARWRQIDPESALRATNARFKKRFQHMEALAIAQGQQFDQLSLDEMESLWIIAKQQQLSDSRPDVRQTE